MHFEIPSEFRHVPEAIKLRDLDAEFTEVCALEVAAVNARLWETNLPAFEALNRRSRGLQIALKEAVAAFDTATGEPRPVELPIDVLSAINEQFADSNRPAVAAKLAKTMAYLQRQRVTDPRIALDILKLAKGEPHRVAQYADLARVDYRDILLSAGTMSER